MRRILGIGTLLALVAVVAALWWLARSLGGIVETRIEEAGSALLGVPVSVGRVSIDLRAGRGAIRRLRIPNPEGFGSGDAVTVGEVEIAIDPASLAAGPIVLTEVVVRVPDVLAVTNDRGLNLDALRRNVERSPAAEADARVAPGDEAPRRFVIRRFRVDGGSARSDTTALGGEVEAVDLQGFALRDLGGRGGGTPGELGKRILRSWLSQLIGAIARHQAKRAIGDAIDEGTEKLGEALKGIFE